MKHGNVVSHLQFQLYRHGWRAGPGLALLGDPAVSLATVDRGRGDRSVLVSGEARAMDALVAYLARVRASDLIDSAYLSAVQESRLGARRRVHFTLEATRNEFHDHA